MVVYVAVAAFCGLFSAIYEYFSHGVYSAWMIFLFAWPLVGGVLPYAVVVLVGRRHGDGSSGPIAKRNHSGKPGQRNRPHGDGWEKTATAGRWARLAHHAAIATLTVGACLSGVFEIYGTASGWVAVYWAAGGVFAVVAAVLGIVAEVGRARGTVPLA